MDSANSHARDNSASMCFVLKSSDNYLLTMMLSPNFSVVVVARRTHNCFDAGADVYDPVCHCHCSRSIGPKWQSEQTGERARRRYHTCNCRSCTSRVQSGGRWGPTRSIAQRSSRVGWEGAGGGFHGSSWESKAVLGLGSAVPGSLALLELGKAVLDSRNQRSVLEGRPSEAGACLFTC
jgi:hypothetical protein